MKQLGIGILFLLCVAAGFGRAARIEARAQTLKNVYKDLKQLLLHIQTRRLPLDAAKKLLPEGVVAKLLSGEAPSERQRRALTEPEWERLNGFLRLLGSSSLSEIDAAGTCYLSELSVSIGEAESRCGSTKLFRAVGALCGAVLAVLLW